MSTTTYIGLLPAVNVGGSKKITMATLAECVRQAGGEHVKTYVQSGNVVFTTSVGRKAVAEAISKEILAATGHEVPVLLRTIAELDAVVSANPFADRDAEPTTLHVVFLDRPAAGTLKGFDASPFAPEEVAVGRHELYLYLPNGMGRAKLPVALGRVSKGKGIATVRNWRTTTKLLELARQIADA